MQPTFNAGIYAQNFSADLFSLKQESFNNSLTDDVVFDYKAVLINLTGPVQTQEGSYATKAIVAQVFEDTIFAITTSVSLKSSSYQVLEKNVVKVVFETREVKSGITYKYTGHFNVTFTAGATGEMKVSKIQLENTREEYQKLSPVDVEQNEAIG